MIGAAATTVIAAIIERMIAMEKPSQITSDRRQSHFSGEQHQDRRTDPVKLTMAMSARFSLKDPKSEFSGGPSENILDYIQEYKLAICEYDLSTSMQKDFFYKLFRTSSEPLIVYSNKENDVLYFRRCREHHG
jgi:hypothetical protein